MTQFTTATFDDQRQRAFAEMERLRLEHPIDTRGERLTRDQLIGTA